MGLGIGGKSRDMLSQLRGWIVRLSLQLILARVRVLVLLLLVMVQLCRWWLAGGYVVHGRLTLHAAHPAWSEGARLPREGTMAVGVVRVDGVRMVMVRGTHVDLGRRRSKTTRE